MGSSKATDRAKVSALERALGAMFARLQARPIPDRLMSIVDQLDAPDQSASRKARRG